jgi:hypothetical protein
MCMGLITLLRPVEWGSSSPSFPAVTGNFLIE